MARILFLFLLIIAIALGFVVASSNDPTGSQGFSPKRFLDWLGPYKVEGEQKSVLNEKRLVRKQFEEQFESLKEEQRTIMETRQSAEDQFYQQEKLTDKAVEILVERMLEPIVQDTRGKLERYHQIESQKQDLMNNRADAEQKLRESDQLISSQLKMLLGDLARLNNGSQESWRDQYQRMEEQQEGLFSHRKSMEENYLRQNEDLNRQSKGVVEGLVSEQEVDRRQIKEKIRDLERQKENLLESRQASAEQLRANQQQVTRELNLMIEKFVQETDEALRKNMESARDRMTQLENQRAFSSDPRQLREKSRDFANTIKEQKDQIMETRRGAGGSKKTIVGTH